MRPQSNSPFTPTARVLRQFGFLSLLFFGAIAAREEFIHGRHVLAGVLATLALTLATLGLVRPRLIRPVFIGWLTMVYPIGWLVSRIVLGFIFYGLFSPAGWISRALGRDPLALKRRADSTSYWGRRAGPADQSHYLRQF
jgi:hypothetical protein